MALAQKKKGGPYPKSERLKRVEEVYRLHFDYGYSARKIPEFLNINRGTINGDIAHLYLFVVRKSNSYNQVVFVMNQIERFEVQRTRLRKQLDNVESFQEKITIERFIFNIDLKIANFQLKLVEARTNLYNRIGDAVNKKMDEIDGRTRHFSKDKFLEVSKKAMDKMTKIYNEDVKYNY